MKTQSQNQFNKISSANESLDGQEPQPALKESSNGQSKTFGLVDLWNIHRQRKTLLIR